MSTPSPDDHSELREALRRDVARMKEPQFDAALHLAAMRRIRTLASTAHSGLRWMPALATAAALALVTALVAVIPTGREPSRVPADVATAIASSQRSITRLSLESPSLFPAWTSPTASLLDPPHIHQ